MQSIKLIAPNLPPPASCVCPNLSSPAVQKKNVRAGNCSALWGKKKKPQTPLGSHPQTKSSPVVNFQLAQACLHSPSPSLHQEPSEKTWPQPWSPLQLLTLQSRPVQPAPLVNKTCFLYLFRLKLTGLEEWTRKSWGRPGLDRGSLMGGCGANSPG